MDTIIQRLGMNTLACSIGLALFLVGCGDGGNTGPDGSGVGGSDTQPPAGWKAGWDAGWKAGWAAARQPTSPDQSIVDTTSGGDEDAAKAEDIVDAHIKSVGGAGAIAKIKTIHRKATVSIMGSFGQSGGTGEQILDLSQDGCYQSMDLVGYFRRLGWSGDSGWVSDTQNGVKDLKGEELTGTKILYSPTPLAAVHAKMGSAALVTSSEKDFRGKKCVVVTVTGLPLIEFYVNQKTKLLDGMSLQGGIEMTYEKYKAVDGVQFAGKSTMKIAEPATTMIFEYTTTEVNGKVDATKFRKPSTPSTPATGSFTAEQIISLMDKNGDGTISNDEASDELKPNFQLIDTNGDGVIDVKEAKAMVDYAKTQGAGATKPASPTRAAAASGPITAEQIISSMDKNDDGKISKDEASEDLKLFFEQYDANKDGAIDAKEAQAIVKYINNEQAGSTEPAPKTGTVTAKQIISFMDKNGDGKISNDEASDELKPNFQFIDTNGDGVIDVKEAQVIADYANKAGSK